MNFFAHAVAKRAENELMLFDLADAGERPADDYGLKVAAVADDLDVLASQGRIRFQPLMDVLDAGPARMFHAARIDLYLPLVRLNAEACSRA